MVGGDGLKVASMIMSVNMLDLLSHITQSGQVVTMTGPHLHDPGCHQASAEVSLTKAVNAHQLWAAVLQ